MATMKTGAVVIGAGPGGYVCAIRLGQLGIPTVCVEKEASLGGVCLNVGCIPSKALITASKRVSQASAAAAMGLSFGEVAVDMGKMQSWKAGIVKKLTGGVKQLLKGNGVAVVRGTATVTGPHEVTVASEDGELTVIEAEAIVVATGSRPIQIPGFEFDNTRILDSTGGLALSELPEHLVVIGGGYIGLELGGTYARLGSKVTVVEMMSQLLPGFDADLVRPVQRKLKKAGAAILLEHKAMGWEEAPGGGLVCNVEGGDGPRAIACDRILVTVGRRPNSGGLGLEGVGVALDERGFITVDAQRRTSVPSVYAIGDVVGDPMLAHKAMAEGEVVAEVIAGKPAAFEPVGIPAIVFTSPEVAAVGLSEKEAIAAGYDALVGKYPFAGLGRAMTTGEVDGFVRVVVDAATKAIIGCQIVGPQASDLIAEPGLAVEMGALVEDVSLTIHSHPTLSEAFQEAARAALGEAVHLISRKRK